MAGLGMILGGMAKGVGDGIVEQAKAKREEALAQLKFERDRQLAGETRNFQTEQDEKSRAFTAEQNALTRTADADYRKQSLDIERQKISATSGDADYNQRVRSAASVGLTPDNPAYQSYVLTGKMPREDAQSLTATDKKAILESDEMVSAAEGTLPLIDRAIELNKKAYDGAGAGLRGWAAGNLGIEGGEATMELDNVVTSQALGQMKAIFGAAPTEGERKILLEIAGSSNQPADVRAGIFQRAKDAVERRLELYKTRANEMRGGTFYKPKTESETRGDSATKGDRVDSAPASEKSSSVDDLVNKYRSR